MHALLYKDFRVMWKQMKAFLLLIAIFCLIPNQALNLSAFFVVYAGLMLPMSLMSYDERPSGYLRRHAALRQPGDRPEPVSGWLAVRGLGRRAVRHRRCAGRGAAFRPAERLVSLAGCLR